MVALISAGPNPLVSGGKGGPQSAATTSTSNAIQTRLEMFRRHP